MVGFSSQESNEFLIEYDNGNVVQDNDRYSRAVASFIKHHSCSTCKPVHIRRCTNPTMWHEEYLEALQGSYSRL